jgi:hypothetical protein
MPRAVYGSSVAVKVKMPDVSECVHGRIDSGKHPAMAMILKHIWVHQMVEFEAYCVANGMILFWTSAEAPAVLHAMQGVRCELTKPREMSGCL